MTDKQIETEIKRLQSSEAVKLAKKYENYKNRRRQYMYKLRWFEKQGLKMMDDGITLDSVNELIDQMEELKEDDE